MPQIAKLFMNGRSQAVRLPLEFRFDSQEVFIRKDEKTGDVILSSKPNNWDGFIDAIKQIDPTTDFLSASERKQILKNSDPFEGWED
jgi:antitoxin VapB